MLFLGWDIGGSKSVAVVGTCDGKILGRNAWPSRAERGPEAMLADFLTSVHVLKYEFGDFSALGVSVGGPLDPHSGIILSPPHLPGWDSYPVRDVLAEKLQLPVTVEHDAAACLLAEYLWGGARGTTHSAYITAGTGCGAGILIDGKVLRGPKGQSVEIGHVRIAESGPLAFGKRGCVESFCSGTGVALLANEMFPRKFADNRALVAAANENIAEAREVLAISAKWMGRVCALLGDIFALEVIIVGSLARYFPDWWLEKVHDEFIAEVLPVNGAHTKIIPSVLGDNLQDLSAIAPCVFRLQASTQ